VRYELTLKMDITVNRRQRPVNLDLNTIRFPAAAIASILHRVSGVIVFIGLAILLWMLGQSLASEQSFNELSELLSNIIVKVIVWGVLTALIGHLVVGIRHLVMDLGYWEEKCSGNLSAKISFVLTALLSVGAGYLLW